MKLTPEDVLRLRAELRDQKEPPRPKKRVGKKLFPVRYSSDYIKASERPRTLLGEQRVVVDGTVTKVTDDVYNYHKRVGGRVYGGSVPRGIGLSEDKPVSKEQQNPYLQPIPAAVDMYIKLWASKTGSQWGVQRYHGMRISASWMLFFYATEYFWEETLDDGTIRRSIIYRSKQSAFKARAFDYVQWVD